MVSILLATYNGEKYIANQLLSLQQQTYKDWQLYVRDDGSTDTTVDIVRQFASADSRVQIVEDNKGNLGAAKSFMALCEYALTDYTVFCDQDDIWFERKLENLVRVAQEKLTSDEPGMVYCNAFGYADVAGVVTIDKISTIHAKDLNEYVFLNAGYQGCSSLFNHKLTELMASYRGDNIYMHDDILSLLAFTFGRVHYLDQSLMLYRQHEKNVTGNIETSIAKRLKRAFGGSKYVISSKHFEEKKAFFEAYQSSMSPSKKSTFEAYLEIPNQGRITRLLSVIRNGFSEGGSRSGLLFKLLIFKCLG